MRRHASTSAAAAAIVAPDGATCSYGELLAELGSVRARLRAAGVRRADAVAVVLPNAPAMATAFLGVAGGAACAPLNPTYREAELVASFDDLQPRALVTDGCAPVSEEVARARGIPILAPSGPAAGPAAADDVPAADDVALVLHTSGTTSRPKQVPLTHAQPVRVGGATWRRRSGSRPDDRCLNVMPLFHIHGLVAALLALAPRRRRAWCALPASSPTAS